MKKEVGELGRETSWHHLAIDSSHDYMQALLTLGFGQMLGHSPSAFPAV